jgi:hypothetical protein
VLPQRGRLGKHLIHRLRRSPFPKGEGFFIGEGWGTSSPKEPDEKECMNCPYFGVIGQGIAHEYVWAEPVDISLELLILFLKK